MSYYCFMYFKQCTSFEEAFKFANNIVKTAKERPHDYMDVFKHSIISLTKYPNEDCDRELEIMMDKHWLHKIYTFKFIWWEEYKLLAFVGEDNLQSIREMFDGKHEFQNSCDQNYGFGTWSDKIELFNNEKKDLSSYSNEEILKKYERENGYPCDDAEYCRDALLYQTIEDKLKIVKWLEEEENPAYTKFTLQGIDGIRTEARLYRMMMIVKKEALKDNLYK